MGAQTAVMTKHSEMGVRHTTAHAPDILGVGWITKSPVVHLNLGSLGLRLPYRVHEDIDSALGRRLRMAIEDRNAEDHR